MLALLAVFCHFTAYADYEPTLLAELIDNSDLIVYAEITAVRKNHITVKVLQAIKGVPPGSANIEKFKDWTCAFRFASYKTGQREILFLKKSKRHQSFFPLGAANEGELPVANNIVYYKQQYLALDTAPKSFKIYGGVVNGYSYDKTQFIEALKFYLLNRVVIQDDLSKNQARIDTIRNPALSRILHEFHEQHFRTY
ncbi:hypothetical protein GCM10022407_04420 [Hymenobacter antarcticus]|uniref:DUF4468 domain-containing protein n=2 Tax=Hymenobacter antarcticus TaxID=486270 RepID=A0ABP7P7L7_9BACT